ncbi:MAG: hypothetical protein KKH28_02625 [Elusimicrobia bacterium]|nr:hypothetical protein [Elusimicrobiota bacterium]
MLQSIDAFLKKWFVRLKILSFLAATWAVFFSVFTLLGLEVGFEYDDGLAFSTPAFQSAQKEPAEPFSKDYWSLVNRACNLERTKPVVWLSAWFFKALGFRVNIFCQRAPAGSDALVRSWKPLAGNFYFTPDEDQKYQLLEKKRFVLYFASSDGGIIQARKAGVAAVRIQKSQKSVLPYEYNPRKFKEPVLPLSEF